jgi:hypothetical protein
MGFIASCAGGATFPAASARADEQQRAKWQFFVGDPGNKL